MPETLKDQLEAVRGRGGWLRLPGRAVLRLQGGDRFRFLNGQCTQDVRELPEGETRYACAVNAKGKLSGDFFVRSAGDSLWLDAEPELQEALMERFDRYIIADDVELTDETDAYAVFHLVPPLALPEAWASAIHSRNDRLGRLGIDLFVEASQAEAVASELGKSGMEIAEPVADLARILAGYARWGNELTESTLPPEALLEERAISYHKGCYTGQEVISRIRSVGRVNRSLVGLEGPALLESGTKLTTPSGEDAGVITSWAALDDLTGVGLGYRKRTASQASLLQVEQGLKLVVQPLPQSFSLHQH